MRIAGHSKEDLEIGTVVIFYTGSGISSGIVVKHCPKMVTIKTGTGRWSTSNRYPGDCIYAYPDQIEDIRELHNIVNNHNQETKMNIQIKFK